MIAHSTDRTIVTEGPHTIAGPGEQCLLCDESLEFGEVYLFVSGFGTHGLAHETCVQDLDNPSVAACVLL